MDSWYSGYGGDSWNTGATNSQEYDGYDYSYTQDTIPSSATNYGYNAGNKTWELPKNTATDTIIAKINKRLDMLSQLETENQVQDTYQDNRFTPYESYDSGSSLNDRDLYRSGYGYSEYGADYNDSYGGRYDHYDSSYGTRKDQFQNRARDPYGPTNQWGQNWSRDRPPYNRPNRNDPFMSPASSGRMSARWNELSMGGRGPNAATASSTRNLPSLFSPNIIPMDLFRVQGSGRPLGGGRQRRRDRNRNRGMKKKDAGFGRKRKQSTASTDEPENKQAKTEDPNGSDAEDDGGESGDGATGEGKESEDKKPKRFPTMQEKKKANKPKKNRDRLAERIMYACSVCKFRTFEDEDISSHVDSKFHKETFKFIATKLDKQTADFLHEYILNKIQKTQKRREQIGDKTILKKQLMQQQDLLQDVGLEHFMKKVEAAHCVACDLFVPMQNALLMRHLKTADHGRNRKAMIEKAKKGSLVVARSVLNNRNIAAMLEKYKKGENPFTDDPDKDEEDAVDETADGDGMKDSTLNDSTMDVENKEGETEDAEDNTITADRIKEEPEDVEDFTEEKAGEATEEETGEATEEETGEGEEGAGGEVAAVGGAGEVVSEAVREADAAPAEDKELELTAEEEDEMLKGDEEQVE
ncbi:A-kinase anchor protein 8-like [Heptranchias perlo]|uniref:A-kinase anchor protein 8-like n=1 Tax=Heptranchias perlo TaxID=212740 RepID=UPI00355978B6